MGGKGSGRKPGYSQPTVDPVLPPEAPNSARRNDKSTVSGTVDAPSLTDQNLPSPARSTKIRSRAFDINAEIASHADDSHIAELQAKSAERAAYWAAEIAKNVHERAYDYEWMGTFLATLRNSGNVRAACEKSGISRMSAYQARDRDSIFRDAWEEAQNDAVDILEAVAWKRAQTQSDTMLIFLLKHNRPEKYLPPKNVEHSGPGGGAIPLSLIDSVIAEHMDTLDVIDGQYEDIPQLAPGTESSDE